MTAIDWGEWWREHERRDGLPPRDGEVVCEECHGIFVLDDTRSETDEQGQVFYWCWVCYTHPAPDELAAMVAEQVPS